MKNTSKLYSSLLLFLTLTILCSQLISATSNFVSVNGTSFYLNNKPFYFSGTNNYYLRYGNPDCVGYDKNGGCSREVLDDAASMGLKVIRTWGFTDGSYYWGALQPNLGTYDDKYFQQLDLVIKEAGERDIKLIIPLVNNWPEYGGMCQYVAWCNITGSCDPNNAASNHDQFYTDTCTRNGFKNYINYTLNRQNKLTGIKYKDDPTIMAWELANEPRAKSDSTGNVLDAWVVEMSSYIKSIDSNHLVTTGEEGFYINQSSKGLVAGTEGTDFIRNHNHTTIDFATFHLYPDNWNISKTQTLQWIDQHVNDSFNVLGKPVVMGEFGKNGTVKDDYMNSWYSLLESKKINGNMFWHLVDHNYKWDDGFQINYPENASTLALIMNDSIYWKNYNMGLSPSNNAPQIQPIANITANEGDLITINVNASDIEGDYIFYSINDAYHFNKNGTKFTWQTHVGLDSGIYNIIVKASDGIAESQQAIKVTVNPASGCLVPVDKLPITRNSTLCAGTYYIPNGLTVGDGVTLDCNSARLEGAGSGWGITIGGKDTTVKNCKMDNYTQDIQLLGASNIKLLNNEFVGLCFHGINIRESSGVEATGNKFQYDNDVGLYAYHSTNITAKQNIFYANGKGIYWDGCSLTNIISNNFTSNYGGAIWLLTASPNNTIIGNIMANNGLSWSQGGGINMAGNSGYNIITGNNISGNYYSITASYSDGNLIYGNNVKNNLYGLYITNTNNNTIYHNNIAGNTNYQAIDDKTNSWDYNGEGNYWSNYDTPAEGCNDLNLDNICDSAYIINATRDNYPFKAENGWLLPISSEYNYTIINASGNIEYRLYKLSQHFMTVIVTNQGAFAIRPHPGVDINGWGSTLYLQPFFPGAVLKYTNITKITIKTNGIEVSANGNVSKGANETYGAWNSFMKYSYDSTGKEVNGSGNYSATLSNNITYATGDLNLYKIASNYLFQVPLISGGSGDTGDMHYANVSGSGYPGFTWQPQYFPSYFPTNTTSNLSIDVSGNLNNVDSKKQGYAAISPAYKPSIKFVLNSRTTVPITFGGIYDLSKASFFWEDNIGVTPLIKQPSGIRDYSFDVIFNSKALAYDGIDSDFDGYISPQDCNVNNATIHPGAQEIINGVDDDCDGSVDEIDNSTNFTCLVPLDGMTLLLNTALCPGDYYLPNGIIIGNSGLNLDCNGARLYGGKLWGTDHGITISQKDYCTIKNCILENYTYGIYVWDSDNNLYTNNTLRNIREQAFHFDNCRTQNVTKNYIANSYNGMYFFWASGGNAVDGNLLENISGAAIAFDWDAQSSIAKNNIIKNSTSGLRSACSYGTHPTYNNKYINNTVTDSEYGVDTCQSHGNIFEGNTIKNNYIAFRLDSTNDTVYHNNIINNTQQVYASYSNRNNSWSKAGDGNYWSNYDEPSEGCIDGDSNDICDSPYVVYNSTPNIDYAPFTEQNGWVNHSTIIACSSNAECGTDAWTEGTECNASDNKQILRRYLTYSCNNPGTTSSYCSSGFVPRFDSTCNGTDVCYNGFCKTIKCYQDSECGNSSWLGSGYCSGGNVWSGYRNWTCSYPGTPSSSCSGSINNQLKEICSYGCANGTCLNQTITPISIAITSPTNQPTYSSGNSIFNISGTISGGTGGINRVFIRTNLGEIINCSFAGGLWNCLDVELLTGNNALTAIAYDNSGNQANDSLAITFTSAYPLLNDNSMRAGMAIQEINMSDNLVPGTTQTIRWKILSYYPLISAMRATFPDNQTATINAKLVGVEAGRWKIGDRNSKVFAYEINWTVPQIPGNARIRFIAALPDGFAYMNANIPGGVDSRPYLADGKEVLRTITSGGTNPGLYNENTTVVPPFYDTLDKAILRAGGTITRIEIPDNLTHGSVVRVRYDVLSYVPLLSRFKAKTASSADIQADSTLINTTDGRWSISTYKSKVYTFEYNWTVPNDPGDIRIRFINAQSDGYAYMNGNIPGGVDSRPYLADGKEVLRTIV